MKALVKIMNDMLLSLDDDKCILLVMLDLSAAFDTVNHTLLLDRFENCFGIKSGAKDWLQSYFADRQQVVRIDGVDSHPQDLQTGMPQGSVLGPFSFPAYTSPLFSIATKHQCSIHMYADDTQFYMSFKVQEGEEALAKMELCVEEVRQWMCQNMLKLNDSKTEFIVISKRTRVQKVAGITSIDVGSTPVSAVPNAKNIGCIIDHTLSMAPQVHSVVRSCYASLYNIARIRYCLTEESAATLVNAQVTSRLDSFNAVLSGIPDYLIYKLQLVQNNAANLVKGKRNPDHITPLLKELHWLPVRFRIDYKIISLCFKALNNLAPQYLTDLLVPYEAGRTLRSSSKARLDKPKTKLKTYGDRAFAYIAPELWNKLPDKLHQIDKLATFKKCLKAHLFKQAYDHVD